MAKQSFERAAPEVRDNVPDQLVGDMDGFEVFHKEPGKEYRWLNKQEANVNRKRLMQGFSIVNGESHVEAGVRMPDGTRVSGDTILAERPIEVGDRMREKREKRKKLLSADPTKKFHQAGEEVNRDMRDKDHFTGHGVSTFEVGEDGRETGKAEGGHKKNWAMGAGIDRTTGELSR